MDLSSEEKGWIRAILLNWDKLSPGDMSTFQAVLATPDARVGTIEGSANYTMWDHFRLLGWARRESFPALPGGPVAAAFVLTDEGRRLLPSFAAHYELVPGTFYSPAPG